MPDLSVTFTGKHRNSYYRWMDELERIRGKRNYPKHPRADLIAFKKWLKPLLFLAQIRVIEIPNPTRSFFSPSLLFPDPVAVSPSVARGVSNRRVDLSPARV
ncbi:hypothetical protein RYX36_035150, partial [Vicia faba]